MSRLIGIPRPATPSGSTSHFHLLLAPYHNLRESALLLDKTFTPLEGSCRSDSGSRVAPKVI